MASLASLLNPSPDDSADGRRSSPPRKDSLPPIKSLQSPEAHHSLSPTSTRSNPQQFSHPPSTAEEAAEALAKLSASPALPPTQWNGYAAQDGDHLQRQRSWERRQSGYAMQLPPPNGDLSRKMSSPTLDQYHVASRSPEQQRPSDLPRQQLPPLQGFAAPSTDQTRRTSRVSNHESNALERKISGSSHANLPQITSPTKSGARAFDGEPSEPVVPRAADASSLPHLTSTTSNVSDAQREGGSSPVVKEEGANTPLPTSPTEMRRPEMDGSTLKSVASLKNESGQRNPSPLRESSVPVPTTELSKEESLPSKKRPAPAKTKKGTASAVKKDKAPPAKKRKVEPKRDDTPSSRASKVPVVKGASTKGTPANSSPAPSTRSYSADPNEEAYDEDDEDVDEEGDGEQYCLCRKPDSGTFMIGCDGTCDDWFHGKCVGIAERDKNLIDKYICPNCTKAGIGQTTWKRMCRRSGCRQPARTNKSKSGGQGSKYCSEECGVLYFREMVAHTRGREESVKSKSSHRKHSHGNADYPAQEDDVGAKGGALAAGEVKALLNESKTAEEFRRLGDGVLSPPATPNGNEEKEVEYTESETQALQRIKQDKDTARRRHAILKDRMKFVTMAKQAGSRTAAERELKPKEFCGYDPRLEWTEERFQNWRNSKAGEQAFELETLATEKIGKKDESMEVEEEQPEICDRKKCARHLEWAKLAVDDIRFEMNDNGDKMRALDREETEIEERATLRAKAGNINGEGAVEVHGLGISTAAPPPSSAPVDAMADILNHGPPKTNGHASVIETTESAEPVVVDTA